ncbi:hypothetical protein [Streptomyces coeruleorubidus]|uniref:hypothetical protein n=1 Tax=Streptomyces coeruleorubidus TaxID=116188 RepID=UPI001873A795|nr:hypothetical protein [Streptomyces bellus]GGU14889.1 hypothetical protein GCM10010244_46750 [Streptomyces bellus]
MSRTPDPSNLHPLPSDPRAARLVEAFRDALIRLRHGEDLTVEELTQMVRTHTGTTPAAAAAPPASSPAPCHCVLKNPEPRWW